MIDVSRRCAMFGVPAVLLTGAWLYAGPLTPPPGAIVGTGKTLVEVEPRIAINATNTPGDADSLFRITQPGSYYLTGNITGVAGRRGIEVVSGNVTIDLKGYALVGAVGTLEGIGNSGVNVDNIRIENGHISGWAGFGISLSSGSNHHFRGVSVRSCSVGISADDNAVVESCTTSGNTSDGIRVLGVSTVVRGCSANANGGTGIAVASNGTVSECATNNNLHGISVGSGSTVVSCSARDNTTDGIRASGTSVVNNCSAYSNGGNGIISLSTSTTITNCTASFNSGDGIEVPGNCSIVGNTCDGNGIGTGIGMGIRATGTDCRIDGNTLMRNDLGMSVELTGNFIVRNIAAGNTTNYQIIADNKVGTIVSAPDSLAIAGSTGGAGVGSTNPWANFSY